MQSTLFILGNGFDLDLNLKTSYKDYLNSDQFSKISNNNSDCQHFAETLYSVYKNKEEDGYCWFDLEIEVGNYYNSLFIPNIPTESYPGITKNIFKKEIYYGFIKSIHDFINNAQKGEMIFFDTQSGSRRAIILAKYISDLYYNNLPLDIYTFNYTTNKILLPIINNFLKEKNTIIDKNKIHSIHGDVFEEFNHKSPSIVVGTSDSYLTNTHTWFVKKSNQSAKSTGKFNDNVFDRYNQFVFFGHSLGEMDHSYFAPIFDNILKRVDPAELIIFTKEGEENIIRDRISKIIKMDYEVFSNKINHKINPDIKSVLNNPPNNYSIV